MATEPAPDRRARGAQVEAAARLRLEQAGLRTLAANVGYRGGELDLVMIDPGSGGETLVFVEVRYRASAAFGGGFASVDRGKRRRLVRAAQLYLGSRPRLARLPCRFDVVEASGNPAAPRIEWMKDAFRLDDV
ncbi:MAG: YraN family protein [Xanthomonadales bacterium]|nr:YraN family protein [Xanthomonadaceae bacterium]MBN8225844.1 YraN family protein [Xanthomonadales bacterium]MCA0196881.1 YraN family protein [Pseudomonadota bacterium]